MGYENREDSQQMDDRNDPKVVRSATAQEVIEPIPLTPEQIELQQIYSKLHALTRSMQQIANLDPDSFNSANRAVSMAKTALLIPIPK